ncbi:MAG: hypothetical protein ACJ788_07335 [Ktedonobacteraceae bacterium]
MQRRSRSKDNTHETVWLAAEYHFPSIYSCCIPMSSMSHAVIMPAPGPATIRLALIRTGIELLGQATVRDELFPTIRSAPVKVRPPERVAISSHHLRAHKWDAGSAGKGESIQESIIVREMAHAMGSMTVYIEVPLQEEAHFLPLLQAVGYWGQTHSFTCCIGIAHTAPEPGMCAVPLSSLGNSRPLRPFFSCLVSEFRNYQLRWNDIVPVFQTGGVQPLRLDIYVWPMILHARQGGNTLLVRHSLL